MRLGVAARDAAREQCRRAARICLQQAGSAMRYMWWERREKWLREL